MTDHLHEHGSEHEAGHGAPGPRRPPSETDRLAATLSTLQFVFTVVVLAVLAGLMYSAGLRAGGGHGGEGTHGGTSGAQATNVDVHALLASTPAQVSAGKSLFSVNCASCHGTEGKGNGPAASALNPKPRDFTSGYWRYGGGVARIAQTITTGSPGTAMAPFPGIPIQDRFALAHYIRSFHPEKQEADRPEDLAWLDQFGGGKGSTGGGTATAAAGGAPGDTLPIERAIALIAEPSESVAPASADPSAPPDSSEEALIYARRCAACHGIAGGGGVRTAMIGSAPYAYVVTAPLGRGKPHTDDAAAFEQLVIRGLPGLMPPNGDLTFEQIRALANYTQSLRARLESAARARS
jgi:mono/diheme cytochrome c family protein